MTMADVASQDYKAAASDSARKLASRLEAAERTPVLSVSYNDLIILNDLAVKCGSDMLRLRASAFAKQRKHDTVLTQAAQRHDRNLSETKQMAVGEKQIALRDFNTNKDMVIRKAKQEYDVLCKMYNAKKPDFERMNVPMRDAPNFSETGQSSGDTGIEFPQALRDWEGQLLKISPDVRMYGGFYFLASCVIALLLQNIALALLLGLAAPATIFVLFQRAKGTLEYLVLALDRKRVSIAAQMEYPIRSASERLDARREAIDATLAKELVEIAEKQAKDLQSLQSGRESSMVELRQTIFAIDAEMLGLLDRLKRLEAAWQKENRQAVAAFSEKSLEWEVPAPKLVRLGTLSLNYQDLFKRASQS